MCLVLTSVFCLHQPVVGSESARCSIDEVVKKLSGLRLLIRLEVRVKGLV